MQAQLWCLNQYLSSLRSLGRTRVKRALGASGAGDEVSARSLGDTDDSQSDLGETERSGDAGL